MAVVTRFKMIAPQITGLSETTFSILASDAYDQAIGDGFTGSGAIRAAGYLAAHFGVLASNANNNIKSESAAVLSHEYFDRSGTDDYLVEYNRLRSLLDGSASGPVIARFY